MFTKYCLLIQLCFLFASGISATENPINDSSILKIEPGLDELAKDHLLNMSKNELDDNWKLNDFFGTIAIINLPPATERIERIKNELQEIGVGEFTIVKAVNGQKEVDKSLWEKMMSFRSESDIDENRKNKIKQAECGCYLSHLKVIQDVEISFQKALKNLRKAKKSKDKSGLELAKREVVKFSRVLILEDDAAFGIVDPTGKVIKNNVGQLLRKALKKLPKNWDMLYFVVKAIEPTIRITPHLRKMNNSWCAVAYAVNYTMYPILIKHLNKIKDPEVTSILPVDCVYGNLHHLYNAYAIYPSIVYHQVGISQISSQSWGELWQGQPICK